MSSSNVTLKDVYAIVDNLATKFDERMGRLESRIGVVDQRFMEFEIGKLTQARTDIAGLQSAVDALKNQQIKEENKWMKALDSVIKIAVALAILYIASKVGLQAHVSP